jgi:uncharacterized repeat protein (TIGR01451 family)
MQSRRNWKPFLRISVIFSFVLGLISLSILQAHISHATTSFVSAPASNAAQTNPLKGRDAGSVPGTVVVRFRSDSPAARATKKGGSYAESAVDDEGRQLSIQVERLDRGPEVVEGLRLLHVAPEDTAQAIKMLRARPDVLYAEPNYIRRSLKLPNDPRFSEMWGLKNTGQASDSGGHPGTPGNDIRAEQAWDLTTGSKNVVVGIVDEGIDINHEDLRDNIWTNPAEIPGNGVDDDGNGFVDDLNGWDFAHNDNTVFDYTAPSYPPPSDYTGDVDDHGTHVAGIIGATGNNGIGVVGVNWQVSLMSLKFLQSEGGTSADLLKALSYAKMMRELWMSSGGTKGANIRVLNNSYGGGGFSQAELDAIRALGDDGILFVVAAGNEALDNDEFPSYPASYLATNLISVAASNGGGARASFSNYGSGSVNMTAPGEHILSTTPQNTYDFFSGTSMATPYVSGSAALICAAYPAIPLQKLRSVLLYTGYVAAWQYIYVYPISTGRSMDVNAALKAVTSPDTTPPAAVSQLRTFTGPAFPNVGLNWGSPGDDGNTGKVAAYEIRYSETDLSNPGAFDLARPLPGPTPDVAGSAESETVRIPWRHPSGFIGVRAVDDVGNAGPISSIPFSVSTDVGDPYTVSESAATPLSTGGIPLGLVADDQLKGFSLPFSFKFYEGEWGGVTVSSNGALYFGNFSNSDQESSVRLLSGYRMIAGAWDDLRTDRRPGDDVYVVTPDADHIIFRWQAVTYDTPIGPGVTRGENPVNFEIELQSTGKIIIRYGDGNQKLFPVVGLGGGWPDPYVVDSHTTEDTFKNLTNAGTVTFALRSPAPPTSANLSLTMTNGPDPVASGAPETYNISVYNNGPYDAPNTVITDVLPAGLTFVSCTSTAGTCSGPPIGSTGTVSVNLGQLNKLVTANIAIVAQATATSGSISNTATVSSSKFDQDLTNNSATKTVEVVAVGPFGDVAAISSSYFVSFALKSDGTVWGWGQNDYGGGILGDGNTGLGQTSTPVQAQNLSGGIAISTGGRHTLVLKSDGTVWAWGSNGSGESGGPPPYPRLTPSIVNGLNNVIAVAAGYAHSMALRNDGTVWVWGADGSGELGLGTSDPIGHPTPVQVPGLTGVTSICAGTGLSVAVRNDGTVWTWGENHNGQLGASGGSLNTPTQVSGVSGVTAVASSFNHVIVRKADGTVMGWGMNAFGQTGSSNLGNVNPTPAQVNGLNGVTAVAAGSGFSLALRSDGTVWGWGLLPGTNTQTTNPSTISGIANAVSIAAGNSHCLALLADRTIRSWGDNAYGQLGDGTTFTRQTPVTVTGVFVVLQPILSSSGIYFSQTPFQVQVLTYTAGAVIHYTLNGIDPTENDPTIASGATVLITQSSTLKARAYKPGWVPSAISAVTYVILNQIDDAQTFVRQHYLDFLGRQPDQSGLDFWTNQITSCGTNSGCVDARRVSVSASFFLSIEFQQTGYLVERLYKTAYGDTNGNSNIGGAHQLLIPIVRFNDFLTDTQLVRQGVVVGQSGWETVLETNKQNFIAQFVQRSGFNTAFPTSMTPAQFVDKLNLNAGNALSTTERATAINLFGNATDTSNLTARAQALRLVAEDQDLVNAEFNHAFVLMQYFGYLRRNPNDAPDNDYSGYDFWLTKLNQFNGNYIDAEMVKAFITSIEYRQRFGAP